MKESERFKDVRQHFNPDGLQCQGTIDNDCQDEQSHTKMEKSIAFRSRICKRSCWYSFADIEYVDFLEFPPFSAFRFVNQREKCIIR